MAQVGMLGDLLFEVSDDTIHTLDNMTWNGAARYAVHERHLTHARTEFAGLDPDAIEFDITLSAYLGVNPQTSLNLIWKYEREGTTLPLVLGRKAYGKYRWTIEKHTTKLQYYDRDGDLTHCVVTVSLLEYLYW